MADCRLYTVLAGFALTVTAVPSHGQSNAASTPAPAGDSRAAAAASINQIGQPPRGQARASINQVSRQPARSDGQRQPAPVTNDALKNVLIGQIGGEDNTSNVTQTGLSNTAEVAQGTGGFMVSEIVQMGNNNRASVTQYGNFDLSVIRQTGTSNTATVVQSVP